MDFKWRDRLNCLKGIHSEERQDFAIQLKLSTHLFGREMNTCLFRSWAIHIVEFKIRWELQPLARNTHTHTRMDGLMLYQLYNLSSRVKTGRILDLAPLPSLFANLSTVTSSAASSGLQSHKQSTIFYCHPTCDVNCPNSQCAELYIFCAIPVVAQLMQQKD